MKKISFNKISISDFIIYFSIILFMSIVLLRPYFSITTAYISLLLANLLLFLNILKEKTICTKNGIYILLIIISFLPVLYKNAYIIDGYYSYFIFYLLATTYSILLFCTKLEKKHINLFIKLIITFSLITSIVTWLSIISPKFYITKIITLLPPSERPTVLIDFSKYNIKMGLTNHYSRNAFYITIGIISLITSYIKDPKKKKILSILFLFITMLAIGKRGHFIFLIISLLLGYIIFNKISFKKLQKLFKITFIILIVLLISYLFIPATHTMYDRIFNMTSNVSSGRFELYNKAWNLFRENQYQGIGWGGFSKSTGYFYAGVHNDYIQLLCETGILGFIAVIFVNISFIIKSLKFSKSKNALSFAILVYNIFFMLYALTGIPHYDFEVYATYFILNCLLYKFYNGEVKNYE